MTRRKDSNKAGMKPKTAVDYLFQKHPKRFRYILSPKELHHKDVSIHAPVKGRPHEKSGGLRMGDRLEEGDIHVISRGLDLSASQLRALESFDFEYPKVIAFQLACFSSSQKGLQGEVEREIDTLLLNHLIHSQEDLRDLNGLSLYGSSISGENFEYVGDGKAYQIVSFPTRSVHMDGLLKVADGFFKEKGKRVLGLEMEIEQFKEDFMKRARKELKVPKRSYRNTKSAGCVGFVTMGDDGYFRGAVPVSGFKFSNLGKRKHNV